MIDFDFFIQIFEDFNSYLVDNMNKPLKTNVNSMC